MRQFAETTRNEEKMSQPSEYSYLEENNDFYRDFWESQPAYRNRYPNPEEAERLGPVLRMISRLIEQQKLPSSDARILDLGSGRGWLTQILSLYGRAEGCEPTPEAVALARRLFPHLTFHACTLWKRLQSPDFAPYDLIVSSEVLEHVPRAEKPRFADEIREGLVSGGFCVLTTPRGELFESCSDSSSQLIEDGLTEKEMRTLFAAGGFEIIAHERAFPAGATLAYRAARKLARFLPSSIDKAIDYQSALHQIWCFRKK